MVAILCYNKRSIDEDESMSQFEDFSNQLDALSQEYCQEILAVSRKYIAKNRTVLDAARLVITDADEIDSLEDVSDIGFIKQVMNEYFERGFAGDEIPVEDKITD